MNYKFKNNIPYFLFILLLTLDVVIMLLQKIASNHASNEGSSYFASLLLQPWLWFSLGLAPFQLFIWTKILARTNLSLAYPISSLSYPLTMISAQFLLRENLTLKVWLGAILITLGVAIIGSKKKIN